MPNCAFNCVIENPHLWFRLGLQNLPHLQKKKNRGLGGIPALKTLGLPPLSEQGIAREDMAGKVPIDSHSPYFLFQELSQAP